MAEASFKHPKSVFGVKPEVVEWLSSPQNPAVRYLTARDLVRPHPSEDSFGQVRREMLEWKPLQNVLALQLANGSFPYAQKTPSAQPTFWALHLMERCGMNVKDEPAARAMTYLTDNHLKKGALSYTSGGSGILPCYVGVVTRDLIRMGGLNTPLVEKSVQWLVDHQRYDHKEIRAGGTKSWSYKAVDNYGCWESVSCYHGVVGAFQALAAIPLSHRPRKVIKAIDSALNYLEIHRIYKKSSNEKSLFRHMTQFFTIGDYRSDLLDVLEGIADADPTLIHKDWVCSAVKDIEAMTTKDRITLVKNYGKKLMEHIPFEPIGKPSRFLTYQWQLIRHKFGLCP